MSKKNKVTIVLCLTMMALIAGCVRPASKSPVGTPSTGEKINTPLPVDQQILNATATAKAIMEKFDQPTPTEKPGEPTPTIQAPVSAETALPTAQPTQTSLPTAMPPTPSLTKPDTYTIHEGEHIYCLARRFNVDPVDFMELNGLTNYSLLSEGDVLKVPTSGSFPGERALNAHPDTYLVSSGETIYDVACYYGDVAPESIIAVNFLVEPYTISAGQTLQIP